jgi:ABC-type multidrug transport system ATPase subunit
MFTVIIGKVGSGKSSLLSACINEMVCNSGTVRVRGKIAYIPQEAFLLNASIRENILFGNPFDKQKYEEVITICQMEQDLRALPAGEHTEIGEKGINLSGGQKQRVSIARAVYSDSDIYLIDDALSALDAYVGKKILDDVFCKKLKGQTKIMVTHHLHVLKNVDNVILMKDGKVALSGKFSDIKKKADFIDFAGEVFRRMTASSIMMGSLDDFQQDEELLEVLSDIEAIYHPDASSIKEMRSKLGGSIKQYQSVLSRDGDMSPGMSPLNIDQKKFENFSNLVLQDFQAEEIPNSKGWMQQKDLIDDDIEIGWAQEIPAITDAKTFMAFDMKQRSFSQIDNKEFEATSAGGGVEKILIEQGILSTKETRYTGFVGGMVFIRYLLETGPWLFSFNAFLFVMVVVIKMATEWWVIKWAELSFTSISTGTYPIVLLILTVISS